MEEWKLQHYLVNFTEACEQDSHDLIKHAIKLKNVMMRLNKPKQEKDILDTVIPLLDDPRAHVRQCAYCIVTETSISHSSSMSPNLKIQRYDNKTGELFYDSYWENTVPEEKQQQEWTEFVAKHKIHIEENRGRRSL